MEYESYKNIEEYLMCNISLKELYSKLLLLSPNGIYMKISDEDPQYSVLVYGSFCEGLCLFPQKCGYFCFDKFQAKLDVVELIADSHFKETFNAYSKLKNFYEAKTEEIEKSSSEFSNSNPAILELTKNLNDLVAKVEPPTEEIKNKFDELNKQIRVLVENHKEFQESLYNFNVVRSNLKELETTLYGSFGIVYSTTSGFKFVDEEDNYKWYTFNT